MAVDTKRLRELIFRFRVESNPDLDRQLAAEFDRTLDELEISNRQAWRWKAEAERLRAEQDKLPDPDKASTPHDVLATLGHSRWTHQDWASWFEQHPDDERSKHIGDAAFHRKCEKRYAEAIVCIQNLLDELDALREERKRLDKTRDGVRAVPGKRPVESPYSLSIPSLLAEHIPWSKATFGPGARTGGITKHIEKELDEIRQNPTDLMEWIDVIILALDGAWRAGHPPQHIEQALASKLDCIRQREYPMPASEDEPSEHVREAARAAKGGG